MRNGLLLVGIAFAVTSVVLVTNRLSDEALAVVVGALCGMTATFPICAGLLVLATRNRDRLAAFDYTPEPPPPPQPNVIVVTPPQLQASPYASAQAPQYLSSSASRPGAPREFRIVGEE